jgi:Secretion system C-terminal sorting domain
LDIDFDLSSVPTWLRRKTLTLVINSNADFSQINVPSGTGIVVTFRGTGNRKIVNLDFTNYVPMVVPVELVDFSGKQAENGTVQLNWRTASEVNLKQFDIEKSSNGQDFKSIGSVKSKGQIQITNYVFSDINFKDHAYYRLKQIDNDGKFEYSKIITIAASTSRPTIKITPSVSDDIWTVDIDYDDLRRAQIEVFDGNGKLMLSQKGTEKLIKTQTLARGLYFVKVTIGQQFWTKKMLKI